MPRGTGYPTPQSTHLPTASRGPCLHPSHPHLQAPWGRHLPLLAGDESVEPEGRNPSCRMRGACISMNHPRASACSWALAWLSAGPMGTWPPPGGSGLPCALAELWSGSRAQGGHPSSFACVPEAAPPPHRAPLSPLGGWLAPLDPAGDSGGGTPLYPKREGRGSLSGTQQGSCPPHLDLFPQSPAFLSAQARPALK